MSAKNKEKIKLEIAQIISKNNNFVSKIASYRSIVNHTILSGCEGYCAWSDVSKNHTFVVIGTKADIKSWCERHNVPIEWFHHPYLAENMVLHGTGANVVVNTAMHDIMSGKLLEWIDEEIYTAYNKFPTPEGYGNTNKNRTANLTKTIKQNLDDVITHYITRHIFWASPCMNPYLKPISPWIRDWCKLPPEKGNDPCSEKEIARVAKIFDEDVENKATSIAKLVDEITQNSEYEADANLVEAALIAKTNPDDPETIQEALDKLFIANKTYNGLGDLRKCAMASVLIGELYAKIGKTYLVTAYLDYAMKHLDQKLDKELIKQCKTILAAMPQNTSVDHIVQIYRTAPTHVDGVSITGYLGFINHSDISAGDLAKYWGGGTYEVRYMDVDKHGHATQTNRRNIFVDGLPKGVNEIGQLQTQPVAGNTSTQLWTDVKYEKFGSAPLNKPHIPVMKPPTVIPIDHGDTKDKKRPQARKSNSSKMILAKKLTPKKCVETEVDFVKAAVSGGLFKNKPNDDDT